MLRYTAMLPVRLTVLLEKSFSSEGRRRHDQNE